MQTTSCDTCEGFRWKPLVEPRCHFGCHDINPWQAGKGWWQLLFSAIRAGGRGVNPSVPPAPADPPHPRKEQAGQISSAKGLGLGFTAS